MVSLLHRATIKYRPLTFMSCWHPLISCSRIIADGRF